MKEQEIEKMAHVLCRITYPCEYCGLHRNCLARNSAKLLYEAGCRMQNKNKADVYENGDFIHYRCPIC